MVQIAEDSRSLTIVVTHTVFCGLTTLLALTGTLLVFLALYRNRRVRTITNLYVMSLAVADVIAATSPLRAIASGSRRWPFGYNFAQFAGFIFPFFLLLMSGLYFDCSRRSLKFRSSCLVSWLNKNCCIRCHE